MLPNPYEDTALDPKVKSLIELGRIQGRLQVYQEVTQSMATIFKANEEGAEFNTAEEMLAILTDGTLETMTAQAEHMRDFAEMFSAKGQDDS